MRALYIRWVHKHNREKANPELVDDLACYFPQKEDLDFFDWNDAIKAMTIRMAASTVWCPNCSAKDRLIIAGMAQNGPGLEWTQGHTVNYSEPHRNAYMNVTNIDWDWFFDPNRNNNAKADVSWFNFRRRSQTKDYGYNFDLRYQLALFVMNMKALSDKGWRLPPGIKYAQLDKIHQLVKK